MSQTSSTTAPPVVVDIEIVDPGTAIVAGHTIGRGVFQTIHDAAIAEVKGRAQRAGHALTVCAEDKVSGRQYWVEVSSKGEVTDAQPVARFTTYPDPRPLPEPGPVLEAELLPPQDRGRRVADDNARAVTRPRPEPEPDVVDTDTVTRPTREALVAARQVSYERRAQEGWRAALRLPPGRAELAHRRHVATIQEQKDGPKFVVVVNTKGGIGKTTATAALATMFGMNLGGYTLAWDCNETMGNLGERTRSVSGAASVVDLLADLDRFEQPEARIGDLDRYIRAQGRAQYHVLASDTDTKRMEQIGAEQVERLSTVIGRFYRRTVIDTGNNWRKDNYQAALDLADQVVLVTTLADDSTATAATLIDALRDHGRGDLVDNAVTVLTATSTRYPRSVRRELGEYFGAHTRGVFDVPFEPALDGGKVFDIDRLSTRYLRAWEPITAAVAEGL